jgi:hypothetical protein
MLTTLAVPCLKLKLCILNKVGGSLPTLATRQLRHYPLRTSTYLAAEADFVHADRDERTAREIE